MESSSVFRYVGAGLGGDPPVYVKTSPYGLNVRATTPALVNVTKPDANVCSSRVVLNVFWPMKLRKPGPGGGFTLSGLNAPSSPGSVDVPSDATPRVICATRCTNAYAACVHDSSICCETAPTIQSVTASCADCAYEMRRSRTA